MAADHLQFLKDKFITDFEEAVDEFGGELPLRLHFQEIQEVLQEKTINDSTPIQMKNPLYDLRYLLAECVMSAEKERARELESQKKNKKSHFNARALKKLWFIRKIGKKLIRIKKILQQTNNQTVRKPYFQQPPIMVQLSKDFRSLNASQIHGFDTQLQKIESFLFGTPDYDDDKRFKAFGIVGMGGVGKTTLARLLLHRLRGIFFPIIWVSLCGKPNPLEILSHMLTQLGAKYVFSGNLNAQLRDLHHSLARRKYLIVVDNVCHQNEWYSDLGFNRYKEGTACFSHGLPKRCGGAIIVTSRFEEVAISMVGEKNLLRLQPTFDAEAIWSMFLDSARRKKILNSFHHQTLLRMKDEIIYRCDGLPLAAKTLAEVISIQLGQRRSWSNSALLKVCHFKVDLPDHLSYLNFKEKIRTLPVVLVHGTGRGSDEIKIEGRYPVMEIVRELEKFWHTELISVNIIGV